MTRGQSLGVAAMIARRELRGGIGGFRVFLVCLALGVAAIAAVGGVRDAIFEGLSREGAVILGGDASVELTYRRADPGERAWLDGVADGLSEIVDFRSMAVVQGPDGPERGLTQVKAVDDAYPLYGAVGLDPPIALEAALAGEGGRPGAVMDRVLADRLGLAVGGAFALGEQEFVLGAILLREPDAAIMGLGLGPRTILRSDDLAASGLLGPGTLYETEYYLRLAPGTDLDALALRAEAELDTTGWRWRDRRDGAGGVGRFVDRLSAFLVLVGIAALAVGGVGIGAAVRAWLDARTATIATLRTLGAERRTVFAAMALQVGAMAVAGIALGLVVGGALPLILAPVIEARLPVPADFALRAGPLLEAALYGALAAAIFTLWPLARVENVRAAALYRDIGGTRRWPRPRWVALTAALVALLVASAAILSGLATLALWSAAGLAVAFVALIGAAAAIRALARRAKGWRIVRGRPLIRSALGSVGGPGGEAGAVVLSLGLGLTVLAAIGQIDTNLRGAIQNDLPAEAPAYFVLDIQPDQLAGFDAILAADPGVARVETAPMLRGVITAINGRAPQIDHWVLRGDRGITHAAAPPPGTTLTRGAWWAADHAGTPQVSFADEEAREIGLELGDTITVDVLGRPITATVTSLREVDFSNAGLGFVMVFDPAALAGAPQTHIATVYAAPEAETRILRALADAYPNITAIRVRDAIDRAAEVVAGIAAAVTWGALAAILAGAVVLIGAAATTERQRTYEAAILKTLGSRRGAILANFALRSLILGAAAGIVAIGAGAAAGWGVMRFVMEADYRFAAPSALAIVAGGIALTVAAGLAFAWRPLAARPAHVLRARE